MKKLTQIINVLKPGEVRLMRNYYKLSTNGEEHRRLELFDLIKEKKVESDKEAAQAIYGVKPNSAYSHLKKRLKNDMLNLLLLQDGSKRYGPEYAQAEFDCRRLFIEGELLLARGAYAPGVEALNEAQKLAVKFELYSEQIMIGDVLRSHLGVKKGVKEYKAYSQDIERALELVNKVLKGKDFYHQILVPNLFQKNRENDFIDYAKSAVKELEVYYKQTNSARIGFFYFYINLFYNEFVKDLPKALECAYGLLDIVENMPPLHSRNRIAGAHLQIAYILIFLQDYERSVKHASLARENYTTGLINELTATEVLFFAAYWGNDFQRAWDAIEYAAKHPKLKANKLNPAKWSYFKANLMFKEQNFEGCQELLMENSELMKDKSGWLFGHKLLEIMTLIEQGYYDLIDFRVESFKKLIQRQKQSNVTRIKVVVHILDSLVKTGKNFTETRELEKANLMLLKVAEGDYNWDPMGYELVRFDNWFNQKATKNKKRVSSQKA